jgi:N-methylhydantoinase B
MRTLKKGQTYSAFLAGGGGWGAPLDRSPNAVLDDVLDEKVSYETARNIYGVVIDQDLAVVDVASTEKLRHDLRQSLGSHADEAAE